MASSLSIGNVFVSDEADCTQYTACSREISIKNAGKVVFSRGNDIIKTTGEYSCYLKRCYEKELV
jgi:hypothetical protein